MAWNADELYGRDGHFLDGLDARGEAFVVEIPMTAHLWLAKPKVLQKPRKNRNGRPRGYPRLRRRDAKPSEVQNLAKYSPAFTDQTPQRYRIKDTQKGPEVWEIRWSRCWRKTHTEGLVSKQCTLIVAKNILTGEVKYFLSNRVPGRASWNLRKILSVAFGRWPVEDCFREAKEELGLDHFECRMWQCIHRHLVLVLLSHLFCVRVREKYCLSENVLDGELLSTEQVRRAMNIYLEVLDLPPRCRERAYEKEISQQTYYQRRNAEASKHHRKRRVERLLELGIDPNKIRSVEEKPGKS